MAAIGTTCVNISELDVSEGAITDRGLIALCYDDDTGSRRAQQLASISVCETQITARGLAFLLQSQPNLRHVEHECLFHVIYTHTYI